MTETIEATTEATALAEGLRDLADHIAAHPEFARPFLTQDFLFYVSDADKFAALASALGGQRDKDADDVYFRVTRDFGPIKVVVYALRETVCERVQVGSEVVEREVLPADVEARIDALRAKHLMTETVVEPKFEWRCAPVLGEAS